MHMSRIPSAFLLITLSACGRGDTAPAYDTESLYLRTSSDMVDSLVSEPFGPSDLIARPLGLVASDRYLFITDIESPFVHVLDVATGDHVRSFGPEGEGPGDFPSAPLVVAGSVRGDTVWFYQMGTGRLSGVPIHNLSVDTLHTISATRVVRLESGWGMEIDGPDAAGNLIGMADTPDGVGTFTYSMPRDSVIAHDTLVLNDKRMDSSYLVNAYWGSLCYVPGRDVWLQFYGSAGRTDIIDGAGATRGEVSVPFRWLPHVGESTRTPGKIVFSSVLTGTRHAYAACAVTDRFVYALYFGHKNVDGDFRQYFNRLPPGEVQVFDMSFKLVKTFVLDHVTSVLAVPPGDTVLFSATYDSTGSQVRRTRVAWP